MSMFHQILYLTQKNKLYRRQVLILDEPLCREPYEIESTVRVCSGHTSCILRRWTSPRDELAKDKKIHGFWENVWEHFSSRQWKGGGIDGRVSPRTGVSRWIVLVHFFHHCVGTRHGCAWWVCDTVVVST